MNNANGVNNTKVEDNNCVLANIIKEDVKLMMTPMCFKVHRW